MLTAATAAYRSAEEPRRVEGLTRSEICEKYLDKVSLIARRVYDRLPPGAAIQLDDLAGWGAIGLLEAFDRFDGSLGIKFSTFAEYRIRGAMVDALRTHDTFSRRRRQLARRIDETRGELRRKLGHEPDDRQMARALEMKIDDYHRALDRVREVNHVSLVSQTDEGRPLLDVISSDQRDASDLHEIDEIKALLGTSIKELPERERHAVLMYYGKSMSGAEIAAVFGVTVSRVSQILSAARKRLRKKLEAHVNLADLDALGMG